jgi:hypothetical protein
MKTGDGMKMKDRREVFEEQLLNRGIFKINGRHFYECSFEEISFQYYLYIEPSEGTAYEDEEEKNESNQYVD